MTSRKSSSRKGNRGVKLDAIGPIPLICVGDAFRWDRKAIRTIAKQSKYLEVEGLLDWPKTAERELRLGLVVGSVLPNRAPQQHYWTEDLLKNFGITGTDVGVFYDYRAMGLSILNDQTQPQASPVSMSATEAFSTKTGIWGFDLATSCDAGLPIWIRQQCCFAQGFDGAGLDRVEVRSKGAWSNVRIAEGGCLAGIHQVYGRQVLFYSEMDLQDQHAVKWLKKSLHRYKYGNIGPWRHTILEPGAFIIIPPAKAHAIYSLEKSISSVHLWLQVDTLHMTEIALQMDAPRAPNQSRPEVQISLRAIIQSAVDDGRKPTNISPLKALWRLVQLPAVAGTEAEEQEDGSEVIVLEDSDAEDAEDPPYLCPSLHVPSGRTPNAIDKDLIDKKLLLQSLTQEMKSKQNEQSSPSHSSPRHQNSSQFHSGQRLADGLATINPDRLQSKTSSKTDSAENVAILRYSATGQHPVEIHEEDLDRLQPGGFLNETLIEFKIKYWINELCNAQPELADQIFIFGSLFYSNLANPDKGYPSVESWTNQKDLFATRFTIVPINEMLDWYLAIIYQPQPGDPTLSDEETFTTIFVFDSLGSQRQKTVTLLRKYLTIKAKEQGRGSGRRIEGMYIEVPLQTNAAESGTSFLHNLESAMELLVAGDFSGLLRMKDGRPESAPNDRRMRFKSLIERLSRQQRFLDSHTASPN